jgi:hypothetical protein
MDHIIRVDQWITQPHAPTAGDGSTAADMKQMLQDQADSGEYLKQRGAQDHLYQGDVTEPWGSTATGAAVAGLVWVEVAGLTQALAGNSLKAGTILLVTAIVAAAGADASDRLDLELAVSVNGGAYTAIGAGGQIAGTAGDVRTFFGLYTVLADLASLSVRVQGKCADVSDSFQCYTPCELQVLPIRKF